MALFTTTNYPLSALVSDIEHGKIGLPELQRPFVWPNVNVRNLFDSLYRGFPAGYLLFWETGADATLKGIGDASGKAASLAIVDGQQRLTSLYAVVKAKEVMRANFAKERIKIAFNPLEERFDVFDASTPKDKSYIPDISVLWAPEMNINKFGREYVARIRLVRPDLTEEQADYAQDAISKLCALLNYQFTTLTLSAELGPEDVAEVFVRINGQGKKLNQADFILTLMSVFWDEGRSDLERFARAAKAVDAKGGQSPHNHHIKPSPDQMLRVGVGLGLKRARLQSVYAVLSARDPVTGKRDPAKQAEQFALLKTAQAHALNLANWHHFLSALSLAGYRHGGMITSDANVLYAYTLYLIGIIDHAVPRPAMRQAIAEFFFMAALTRRYTNSAETTFEFDLAQLRAASDAADYLNRLSFLCSTALTKDYWEITLPSALATSAAVSPSRSAYQAALIRLDARVLYSPMKVADLVDPVVKGSKSALEQHHLFPRAYLANLGVTDDRQVNQIANFAVLEWPENLKIGAQAPADYAPALEAAISPEDRQRAHFWHALPEAWWEMPYDAFLRVRRELMAKVVKSAYDNLTGGGATGAAPTAVSVSALIAGGESGAVEFKSTLRINLHTGQPDEKIQLSALKTIAGFLNAKGGTLIIGVADEGQVLGLANDGFPNEDKLGLHLVNMVRERIGEVFLPYVHPHFEDQDGGRVLVVRCEPGPKAAFVKDGQLQRFYVRAGASTAELSGGSILDYQKSRFG